MGEAALAGAKKKCRAETRTIFFVDESGLSERPTHARTWAPKGQIPILQYSFNWKQLSLIAGATVTSFYVRFFPGAIKGLQLIEFLKALLQQIKDRPLVPWDGLPTHRSRLVRDYVESLTNRLVLERLPA